jgi:hypothetical protein
MIGRIFFVLLIVAVSGCAGTTRYTMTGAKTYELEVVDDGVKHTIHSSQLHKDWEDEANKLCPQGYSVVSQTYHPEKVFKTAYIVGTIECR